MAKVGRPTKYGRQDNVRLAYVRGPESIRQVVQNAAAHDGYTSPADWFRAMGVKRMIEVGMLSERTAQELGLIKGRKKVV